MDSVNMKLEAAAARTETADDRRAERAARKAERRAAKQQAEAERRRQRQEEAEARRAAERREREATVARAYEHYRRVRDWSRRVSAAVDSPGLPLTPDERRMTEALAALWDAPPEAIAGLRRWSEPMTGVRPSDYDSPSRDLALRLKYAVATLRRHAGADLFVQELPLLGGFGVEWHRQYYNEDTVRFFKALVGLQDGGVLGACRGAARRRLVWEIGGGWGGFAFQFKTICPNVTYVITGLPELLLVSAVYLMTACPAARCRFCEPDAGAALWTNWEEADFIFIPDATLAELTPPSLDVTLDIMALRSMTHARVALHVERAFALGSRYFFSQLPGPCFPQVLPTVWQALERRYWLHQVPPPLDVAAFVVDRFDGVPVIDDYAQVVGWRRLRSR